MLRTIGRYLIALVAGVFLVSATPWLIAVIAALPGLRLLIDGIRAAGLPLQYVYHLVTQYLPVFLLAFAVGIGVFRFVSAHRAKLLVTMVFPWCAWLAYVYLNICVDTDVSCFGSFPFHEFAGILDVPLGLVLASFAGRPRIPPRSVEPEMELA